MIKLTYIIILAFYSFRIIIAIVAKLDLETKQYNIVNIFVNILYDLSGELVIYYLPNDYKITDIVAIINRALYRLYNSPAI
jgi:hypothetical protein